MRALLVVLLGVSGCFGYDIGPGVPVGDMAHGDQQGDMAGSHPSDAATGPACTWALTMPTPMIGSVPVSSALIADARTQCITMSDAVELKILRSDGFTDDFTATFGATGKMHLYRLVDHGKALPYVTCQTWSGSYTITAPPPTGSVQFDLTCTEPNGGLNSFYASDMGAPTTRIAGTISVTN